MRAQPPLKPEPDFHIEWEPRGTSIDDRVSSFTENWTDNRDVAITVEQAFYPYSILHTGPYGIWNMECNP
ncbi:hypothetical protein HZ326_18806 [Fusarium oxysporum f. sp. albedinis]|nr:hypothetical protein HZ326_18806 [Fusarium oxysporum f. sp. albedinis]